MYAVIRTGGKQYRVRKGDVLNVEKLDVQPGAQIELDDVLLVNDDANILVGTPCVEGARVTASVVDHGRDKKVIIFKYRRRKTYRRKKGHRQHFTRIEITDITA